MLLHFWVDGEFISVPILETVHMQQKFTDLILFQAILFSQIPQSSCGLLARMCPVLKTFLFEFYPVIRPWNDADNCVVKRVEIINFDLELQAKNLN